MIYEVCALVATIILGMLGLELVIWIRSVRKLTDEIKQTVHDLNTFLPSMLENTQAISSLVRQTTEQVGGTVSEVAVGIDKLRKDPLYLVKCVLVAAKEVMGLWQEFRERKKDAPNR